jgi:hypothetical protein
VNVCGLEDKSFLRFQKFFAFHFHGAFATANARQMIVRPLLKRTVDWASNFYLGALSHVPRVGIIVFFPMDLLGAKNELSRVKPWN